MIKNMRKIIILILSIGLLVVGYHQSKFFLKPSSTVHAFGNLQVVFPSEPLFSDNNWFPGKTLSKVFSVENQEITVQKVGIKANNHVDDLEFPLSGVLGIQITQGSNSFYGEGSLTGKKHLSDFYQEQVVWLGQLSGNEKLNYTIVLSMENEAGNNFQNKGTSFDLLVGSNMDTFIMPTLRPLPTLRKLPTFPPIPTIRKISINR